MSGASKINQMRVAGIVLLSASVLSGCTYDYLNHDDRIGYSSGDAVRANLARETTNPSKTSQNDVHGLGADGEVIPDPLVPGP